MDEVLAQIASVCQGMSPEDIAAQITASQHADLVQDPEQLARLFAAIAGLGPDPAAQAPDAETPPDASGND